ncbi:MAG: hypothetical protein AAB495_01165 [Patescibacteria group bacterium]
MATWKLKLEFEFEDGEDMEKRSHVFSIESDDDAKKAARSLGLFWRDGNDGRRVKALSCLDGRLFLGLTLEKQFPSPVESPPSHAPDKPL